MSGNPSPRLTEEEYLALDRVAEWKSEFHDGEMFPIEAVSLRHSLILDHFAGAVRSKLRAEGCQGLPGPLRVRASASRFFYPGYQILCGKAQLADENQDTVVNPKVIVEVLSRSTADYDHGAKFSFYRQLSSLEEYVLISQFERKVEVFTKQSDHYWALSIFDPENSIVQLASIGIDFALADLYDGIDGLE
ncbi:MAG: Uma2 family endonuclease [Acidobacteria bacterium]|nr:Uma2 family endonuclease [Acidobacteriota bacterium]